jgi:tellurite resistance protein TerC
LVYSGIKLFCEGESEIHPEKNPVLRLFRKFVPVTKKFEGDKFFVRRAGLYATPLFIVLLVVETTDVLFAVDSIPAILAITLNTFVVYTSNVFAILGLRAMYFALAGMLDVFHYLHYGLAVILMFVGVKMLGSVYVEIPTIMTLGIVGAVLAVSVGASLVKPKKTAGA